MVSGAQTSAGSSVWAKFICKQKRHRHDKAVRFEALRIQPRFSETQKSRFRASVSFRPMRELAVTTVGGWWGRARGDGRDAAARRCPPGSAPGWNQEPAAAWRWMSTRWVPAHKFPVKMAMRAALMCLSAHLSPRLLQRPASQQLRRSLSSTSALSTGNDTLTFLPVRVCPSVRPSLPACVRVRAWNGPPQSQPTVCDLQFSLCFFSSAAALNFGQRSVKCDVGHSVEIGHLFIYLFIGLSETGDRDSNQ